MFHNNKKMREKQTMATQKWRESHLTESFNLFFDNILILVLMIIVRREKDNILCVKCNLMFPNLVVKFIFLFCVKNERIDSWFFGVVGYIAKKV